MQASTPRRTALFVDEPIAELRGLAALPDPDDAVAAVIDLAVTGARGEPRAAVLVRAGVDLQSDRARHVRRGQPVRAAACAVADVRVDRPRCIARARRDQSLLRGRSDLRAWCAARRSGRRHDPAPRRAGVVGAACRARARARALPRRGGRARRARRDPVPALRHRDPQHRRERSRCRDARIRIRRRSGDVQRRRAPQVSRVGQRVAALVDPDRGRARTAGGARRTGAGQRGGARVADARLAGPRGRRPGRGHRARVVAGACAGARRRRRDRARGRLGDARVAGHSAGAGVRRHERVRDRRHRGDSSDRGYAAARAGDRDCHRHLGAAAMPRYAWLQKHPAPAARGGEFHWYPSDGDRELYASFAERLPAATGGALWQLAPGEVAWALPFVAVAPDGRRYTGLALAVAESLAQLVPAVAAPRTEATTEPVPATPPAQPDQVGVARALLAGGNAAVGTPEHLGLPRALAAD